MQKTVKTRFRSERNRSL